MVLVVVFIGSFIGLLIDCFILKISGIVDIIEVWSEFCYIKIILLFLFFGIILYFYYDNFKINW